MILIDKDVIITEIEASIKGIEVSQKAGLIKKRDADKKIFLFKSVLSLIDTLEVKEVDLEKELNDWRHKYFHGRRDKEASGEYLERITQLALAKHFFELGLKAQKGE